MFLFSPCQVGAEKVLKSELKRLFPSFRPSFARPGFMTIKAPDEAGDPLDVAWQWAEKSIFARTASLSLDMFEAGTPEAVVENAWKIVSEHRFYVNRVHVYRRDPYLPGDRNFEPGLTPELIELHRLLTAAAPNRKFLGFGAEDVHHPALLGETILDVVEIDPGRYFAGLHRVQEDSSIQAYYPGGVMPITLPAHAVSRAWLKFEEGLRWGGFPIGQYSQCLDIGAAPGGGSQALLDRGATVLGVDPAEIDPVVLRNPNFTHIRGRMNQTRRSQYKGVRWAIADMNVAPGYTIDVLEELVARRGMKIRGLLFTLKMFQWELAEDLPFCVDWIRRWGFDDVRIKQLAFNRREVMVAAQKTATK